MTRNPRRLAVVTLVSLLVSAISAPVALAAPGDIGHEGPSFVSSGGTASGSKPESKLWFHDGLWWGSLWDTDTNDFHIHRLDLASSTWVDTGVALDDRPTTRADVLWDGTKLYVASHRYTSTPSAGYPARLYRFSYDATHKTWTRDPGFPATIHDYRTETMVIDKDTTGVLWATWVRDQRVYVSHTAGNDATWVTPYVLPGIGTTVDPDDISSVIAFQPPGGPGRIGVMWSNQTTSTVYFATHDDGAPDGSWTTTAALQGSKLADDHVNLKAAGDGSGRVFAAVKTSNTTAATPLVMLLTLDPTSGAWSSRPVANVSDSHTRPIVVIDQGAALARVVMTGPQPPATSGQNGGSIYEKTAPLADPIFATGLGTPIIRDADVPDMNDPSSTKQPLDGSTGMVILAGNDTTDRYWWSFDPLGGTPPVVQPPVAAFSAAPTAGPAPLAVSFADLSTNLPTSWAWDFDGDGVTDSTMQHPSYVYSTPGTYPVRLTASNSAGADEETRIGYVTVGQPLAYTTVTPTADAFVNSSNATRNYGLEAQLRVRDSSTDYVSYLSFDVTGVSGPVRSAKLRLMVTDASPSGGSVRTVAGSFTETGITWSNAPAPSATPIAAVGATSSGQWQEVDLGSAITGNGTVRLAIVGSSSNSAYYSSRQGANPPQLVIGYETGGSPPSAPVAAFLASPTSGSAPLAVQFTDTSTNGPTSWAWDVDGDGTTDSTAQHPTHAYVQPGTYTVTLTAANAAGSDVETKVGLVSVSPAPTPTPTPSGTPDPTPTPTGTPEPTPTPTAAPSPTAPPTASPTPPGGSTLVLAPAADARIAKAYPSSNYGADSTLRVRLDSSGDHQSYLRFSVSGITGTVTSVKLRLHCSDASPGGGTVYVASSAWTESTLTWSNAPGSVGGAVRTIGAVALDAWVEVDLTGVITADGQLDLVIKDGNSNSAIYGSRESSTAPQLVITQTP
jgi:PKD repeat protein